MSELDRSSGTDRLHLIDTSVLVHLVRADEIGIFANSQYQLTNALIRPLVSVITHGEFRVLADRNNWGTKKVGAMSNALGSLTTVDLSEPVIAAYVEVQRASRLEPAGARNLSHNDCWIAACAKATQSTLLTTDKDFLFLHPRICSVAYIDPAGFGVRK